MPRPVLLNMLGKPYTDADAARYLEMLSRGAYLNPDHKQKSSSTFGLTAVPEDGHQKRLTQVLRQKIELSNSIKKSYDEHKRSGGSKDALFELGRYVAYQTGASFVPGPLKGLDGVIRKVMDFTTKRDPATGAILDKGYQGNYAGMKDEVRMTLVADDKNTYTKACIKVKEVVDGVGSGMMMMKNNPRNPDDDPCGYSDTNMVVRLPNGEPGEIQVNQRAIIYGKMADYAFREQLQVSHDEYMRLAMNYEIDGGMGHVFYEIYRVAPESDNGTMAAKLSKRYYNVLRTYPLKAGSECRDLAHEINEFRALPEIERVFMEGGVQPVPRGRSERMRVEVRPRR